MIKYRGNGYIALISVIIIGAIILMLVLGLTFISLSHKLIAIGQNQSLRSLYLAQACAYYGLLKLQTDVNYAGNEEVSIDANQNCRVNDISGIGNTDRLINASANINNNFRKFQISISQIKPQTIINYAREVN